MASEYSIGDVLALIQLSWSAVEGARRACGKHDDLTKEVSNLYDVLAHVYSEMSVPESLIGQARKSMRAELENHMAGCDTQLRIINTVLNKFNALSPEQKFGKQLWSKIRFAASGRDQDLAEIRSRMVTYSTAITMSLRLMSFRNRGKVERQLSRQRGSLEGLRESVNFAVAYMNSTTREKSLMLAYSNGSKTFWRNLRRELVRDGFSRSAVNCKKDLILSYVEELDSRGILGYSTSFQKALAAQNDAARQSNTPTSFQSSSTLTEGRDSNSSLHYVDSLKQHPDYYSSFDAPFYDRSGSNDTFWPDSRPATAVEHEQDFYSTTSFAKVGSNEHIMEPPSPSIPYRARYGSNSTESSRTLYDEFVDSSTEQVPYKRTLNMDSFSDLSRQRSMSDEMEKIRFEDPHGREFSFPLSQAQTWEGMESLIKKNCAGMGNGIVESHPSGGNILPRLWEETAEPGAKLTIRRPSQVSQPSVFCAASEEFYLLPERPTSPEDDFSHLPTLGDWIQNGWTEFTPHSEFYEMD